jgi:DsbC/DsbD-like thiol-disulfide interchange protein
VLLLASLPVASQNSRIGQAGNPVLTQAPDPTPVIAHRGKPVTIPLQLILKNGYHMNSNQPKDEYLIPLRVTWDPSVLTQRSITYPPPKLETYEFSDKPLSVYSSDVRIDTALDVPADAKAGPLQLTGKVRYQACTDKMCLQPKTFAVAVPIEIR